MNVVQSQGSIDTALVMQRLVLASLPQPCDWVTACNRCNEEVVQPGVRNDASSALCLGRTLEQFLYCLMTFYTDA